MVLLLSIVELEESRKGVEGWVGYQLRALDRRNGFNAAVRLGRDPLKIWDTSPSTLDTVLGGVDSQIQASAQTRVPVTLEGDRTPHETRNKVAACRCWTDHDLVRLKKALWKPIFTSQSLENEMIG